MLSRPFWVMEHKFTSEVNKRNLKTRKNCLLTAVSSISWFSSGKNKKAGPLEETPLHIASHVLEGGEKCVQMLLKSGCDVNMRRADGATPLMVAADKGHFGVVRLLLVDGADAQLTNDAGETALQISCKHSAGGSLKVVQLLLDHVRTKNGSAASYVNTRNAVGETALHAASSQSKSAKKDTTDHDIAQALVQAGGDVSYDTFEVQNKMNHNFKNQIKFFSFEQTKENPLHYCAAEGNVAVLAALLASIRPTDLQRVVNRQNTLGRSPLIVAAKNGHLECVHLLLQNQVLKIQIILSRKYTKLPVHF